jgi:hypothetical protein
VVTRWSGYGESFEPLYGYPGRRLLGGTFAATRTPAGDDLKKGSFSCVKR